MNYTFYETDYGIGAIVFSYSRHREGVPMIHRGDRGDPKTLVNYEIASPSARNDKEEKISRLHLPQKNKEVLNQLIFFNPPFGKGGQGGFLGGKLSFSENDLSDLKKLLNQYFKGIKVSFNLKPDLSGFSPFEKKVYSATMKIPYGNVRSYKWIAEKSGNLFAARAVGTALKKNPLPLIIPCHRVVKSDNSLGGYNAGTDWKKELLRLEGIFMD